MSELVISNDLKSIITPEQAWEYRVIPLSLKDGVSLFAIDQDVDQEFAQAELELICNAKVEFELYTSEIIASCLHKSYARKNVETKTVSTSDKGLVHQIINDAYELGCSDIHIECYESIRRVRFRLDGDLIERYKITEDEYPALINKIKILAHLDISERRLPQDGRILYEGDKSFDIRVSSLPTLHGEKLVLRLLGRDASMLDIDKLGFDNRQYADFKSSVSRNNGIVLISGPTGSGKTTTLYATLNYLNNEKKNILTIEDPIEYTLPGINQVQLKPSIGLNYTTALKTFLRQDPDIIMVGEIRDEETANMAIRAALTGHLVLSTIHTNSAWGIVTRLLEMNVPEYILSGTLNSAVAQRLIRKLCNDCREPALMPERATLEKLNIESDDFTPYKAIGCPNCHYTGFKGRGAIYEVIPIGLELSNMIKKQSSDATPYLASAGITSLNDHAVQYYMEGTTTLEEIINFADKT